MQEPVESVQFKTGGTQVAQTGKGKQCGGTQTAGHDEIRFRE